MGYAKELKEQQAGQRRRMREERKRRQWKAPQPTRAITWDDALDIDIVRMVQAVTRTGAAIMFGVTRTGGALVVRIFDGDDRAVYYANSQFEVTAIAGELERIAEDAPEVLEAPPTIPLDMG